MNGRQAAGPRYRSQSTSSLGGSGSGGGPAALHGGHAGRMGVDGLELAELSAPRQFDGELDVRQVAPLRAGLEDLARAAEGLGQDQALGDVLRAGLLAIDVLAGVGRQHRGRGVPVRAGGDQHGVDVVAGQQLAEVAVGGAVRVAVLRVDHLLDRLAALGLHVADGHEPDVGLLQEAAQVVAAAVADADAADDDLFARRRQRRLCPAPCRE